MRHEKVVLIAGGAGSIGSALVERLASSGMTDIIAVDKDENRLEYLRLRLAEAGFDNLILYVADLRNLSHVNRIFAKHTPDLVFNCAAHKHVVSGQRNVAETTRNNLLTTLNLLKARHRNQESKFIHISTDKAVEPTSVMGASKMLCECMVRHEFPKTSKANSIVRFGNVKGTQGSVLEIWKRQLAEKKPLSVTDLSMKRYMMSIDDACSQIMRLVGFESGTYLLDMGPMFTVKEMLASFLKESEVDLLDYKVNIMGGKPGEKKVESLYWPSESFQSIKAGNNMVNQVFDSPRFDYDRALKASEGFDDEYTLKALKSIFGGSIA